MRYKTWYIIPTLGRSVEPEITDFSRLSSSTSFTHVDRAKFRSSFKEIMPKISSRPYAIVEAEGHTCRETMLDDIDDIIYKAGAKDFLKGMRVFIVMEEPLSDKLDKMVMRFGETFLWSSFCQYHVYKIDKKIVLTYRYEQSHAYSQAWAASLLLYIFQHERILEDLLKQFKSSNLTDMYNYLSVAFLKNTSWGNYSNPCVPISLFCYHQANGLTFSQESIMGLGPVEAAYKYTKPNVLMNYVSDVFIKTTVMKSVNFGSDGFGGNPGLSFSRAFNSVLGLCYKAQAYDEIMEKRKKASLRRAAKK